MATAPGRSRPRSAPPSFGFVSAADASDASFATRCVTETTPRGFQQVPFMRTEGRCAGLPSSRRSTILVPSYRNRESGKRGMPNHADSTAPPVPQAPCRRPPGETSLAPAAPHAQGDPARPPPPRRGGGRSLPEPSRGRPGALQKVQHRLRSFLYARRQLDHVAVAHDERLAVVDAMGSLPASQRSAHWSHWSVRTGRYANWYGRARIPMVPSAPRPRRLGRRGNRAPRGTPPRRCGIRCSSRS